MNCAFDKEKLSAFYDGELAVGEKAEVERHIASCSECLRDLGELKSAALLIKELPRLRAPRSIAEGVSREIQAAGKVHVLARFRRTVLWVSATAAGLFIVANVVFLTQASKAPAPMAVRPTAAPMAQVAPPSPRRPDELKELQEADRAMARDQAPVRRQEEALKSAVEAGKPVEEKRKLEQSKANEAEKAAAPVKAAEAPAPKPAAAPMPAPEPKPSAPTAPVVAKAEPSKPPADSAERKTVEAPAKADADPRTKAAAPATADAKKLEDKAAPAAAAGPAAEPAPVQYTVVITQLAKARPRIEESLKKMGAAPPPPVPMLKGQPRNREAENTLVLELTDAQLLRLRDELEKPGDARLVAAATANSVDPVLPAFRSGGIYAKKDAASGGAKAPAPVPSAKDKDGKELEVPAEPPAEPKRRVTLHLTESRTLPPADGEAPARKN